MVLLTSGTVSAALSSGIVFLFTSALFLSGYVLQQKTVSSLRQQIKEPARPTHTYIYLPPQFANPTPAPEADGESAAMSVRPGTANYEAGGGDDARAAVAGLGADAVPGGTVIAVEVGSQIPLRMDAVRQSEVVQEDPARSLEGLSRAERRRRIKEDIAEATKQDRQGYHRRTY